MIVDYQLLMVSRIGNLLTPFFLTEAKIEISIELQSFDLGKNHRRKVLS